MKFLKLISNFILIFYVIEFIKWYARMLVHPKWFWIFWLNLFIAIAMKYNHNVNKVPYDHRTGAEVWNANQ
jgi:hypothetical protein